MDRKVITSTGVNENGELLWCVHFASSYYDGESTVPVNERFFALAKNKDEAEKKVKKNIADALKRCDEKADKKIETTVASLENFIVARDSSNDGRLGWHSTNKLSQISLTCEEDQKVYRLQACLVPIN